VTRSPGLGRSVRSGDRAPRRTPDLRPSRAGPGDPAIANEARVCPTRHGPALFRPPPLGPRPVNDRPAMVDDGASCKRQMRSARRPRRGRPLEEVRSACRARQFSDRTVDAYTGWVRRYVVFHGTRHPRELDGRAVAAFLTHLGRRARRERVDPPPGLERADLPVPRGSGNPDRGARRYRAARAAAPAAQCDLPRRGRRRSRRDARDCRPRGEAALRLGAPADGGPRNSASRTCPSTVARSPSATAREATTASPCSPARSTPTCDARWPM
jgi:hypothetical protein